MLLGRTYVSARNPYTVGDDLCVDPDSTQYSELATLIYSVRENDNPI
jgi:hypothetical protein